MMENQIVSSRLQYMDIAKGVGIIWVIIGHTLQGILYRIAFCFHMPLFFIIAGYFVYIWDNNNAGNRYKKCMRDVMGWGG